MKKLIFFALTAILSISLTSCESDPDEYIAYSLEGIWEGYTRTSNGEKTYTTIEFYGDPYNASIGATGTGRWLDDYRDGTWFCSRFKWQVTREDIVIYLLDNEYDDRKNYLYIDRNNYRLNGIEFTGTLEYLGGFRNFYLEKVASFDWDRYPYGLSKKAETDFSKQ
ncbi:hypothetical protein E5358_10205 [Palleniella muris]|uniref:Uncharacterized protein n=1 Tax=Palleniella muris TaxID=3038145 RepID=A0AC61QP40_9BACT|nr:hypothetical protein [Palleniella muris]TGX81498.1 hypothetical protein E5358_10205 [Palleniella muris]